MAGDPYSKADQCGPSKPKPATKQRRKWKGGQIVRAEVANRSGGLCEIGLDEVCRRKAVLFHHRLRRAQRGPDTFDNLLHLCDPCHVWLHANTGVAYRRGWLLRSTDDIDPYVPGGNRHE